MDTSNIIALTLGGISFIISVVGFIITPVVNLKSKRLEYRFELFQRILELWECTNRTESSTDEKIKSILSEINKSIQLYGYNSEIKLFKELVESYNYYANNYNEYNRQKLVAKFSEFYEISFNTYRKEILLEKLED